MKNMSRGVGVVAVLGLCLVGADARAADILYDGTFCTPVMADQNRVEHGPQYGVHNVSGVTTTVRCPFNPPFFGKVSEVDVMVFDRHPSANVECTLLGIDLGGSVIWSQYNSSSGYGSGLQFLVFYPQAMTHTMTMTCTIPAYFGGNLSHVVTYRAIHSP